jgi:hypothetical protein
MIIYRLVAIAKRSVCIFYKDVIPIVKYELLLGKLVLPNIFYIGAILFSEMAHYILA